MPLPTLRKMLTEPDYILPDDIGFNGSILDNYLALGYYRMQHLIFTTNHTRLDLGTYAVPVFWLRILINNIQEQKSAAAIRKKCEAFTVVYKKAVVTPETEALYRFYRSHMDFSTAISSKSYLHQSEIDNPFDSWMIEVRDGTTLIAVGYFDRGENAMAGILNFYNPSYSKYSLGKYLILKKIDFAAQNNIPLYYTGYISTTITKFDYKLFPCAEAVEVYLPAHNQWQPYNTWGKQRLHQYFQDHLVNGS